MQQTEVTRSLAEEIQLFDTNLYQELISERQILALTDLIDKVDDVGDALRKYHARARKFRRQQSEHSVSDRGGQERQGQRRRKFSGQPGPLREQGLQRAFTTPLQSLVFRSDPLAIGPENRPAFVMAVPLEVNDQFSGMLAAVVSLDGILRRLQETSVRGRVVFVVDHSGHIVAHPDMRQFVPGADARPISPVVAQVNRFAQGPAHDRNTSPLYHQDGETKRKWSEPTAPSRT